MDLWSWKDIGLGFSKKGRTTKFFPGWWDCFSIPFSSKTVVEWEKERELKFWNWCVFVGKKCTVSWVFGDKKRLDLATFLSVGVDCLQEFFFFFFWVDNFALDSKHHKILFPVSVFHRCNTTNTHSLPLAKKTYEINYCINFYCSFTHTCNFSDNALWSTIL